MDNFTTKDSGQRREFGTGAKRDQSAGKGRFDLLNWDMIERDAQLLERGALKYDDNNWKKGIPLKSFLDSAARHLSQLIRGDRSEDHAAAVRWNVSGYEWTRAEVLAGRLPATLAEGTTVLAEFKAGLIAAIAREPAGTVQLLPKPFSLGVSVAARSGGSGPAERRSDRPDRRLTPSVVGFNMIPKPWLALGRDGQGRRRADNGREGRRWDDRLESC